MTRYQTSASDYSQWTAELPAKVAELQQALRERKWKEASNKLEDIWADLDELDIWLAEQGFEELPEIAI